MPSYAVYHAIPLSSHQEDTLAEAITSIHLSKWPLVPPFFVNVAFTNVSHHTNYIGGKRRRGNDLVGYVRKGDRPTAEFEDLRDKLQVEWNGVVVGPAKEKLGAEEAAKYELQRLVMSPSNPVGLEGGFEIVLAGQEKAWLEKYWSEFKKRADAGDEQFIDLVKHVEAERLL